MGIIFPFLLGKRVYNIDGKEIAVKKSCMHDGGSTMAVQYITVWMSGTLGSSQRKFVILSSMLCNGKLQ